jgi:5-methylcytosine-specific restriction endonuclease McrA
MVDWYIISLIFILSIGLINIFPILSQCKSFSEWKLKFYNSHEWRSLRDEVFLNYKARCVTCKRLIRGRYIVHHIKPITPSNCDDFNIILNPDNCELLCLKCHNDIHNPINLDLSKRKDVNLF